jgi:hypothetical protein
MICIIVLVLIFVCERKEKHEISCVLYVFLSTNGFQLVSAEFLSAYGPTEKPFDYALIFLLYCMFNLFVSGEKRNYLFIFLSTYIIFVFAYSVFYEKNLFLFSPIVFHKFGLRAVLISMKCMFFVGIFLIIAFSLQIVVGQSLIPMQSGSVDVLVKSGDGFDRYYNLPFILPFCVFYVIFWHKFFNNYVLFGILAAALLALVLSQNRGTLFAVLVMVIFMLSYIFKAGYSIIIAVLPLIIFTYILSGGDRVQDGLLSVMDIINFGMSVSDSEAYENTMLFRLRHLQERFSYLSERELGLIFGVGFMSDGSPLVYNMNINFGLVNELTGDFFKIDTSDIVWSLLLMNFGLLGVVLTIFLLFYLINFFTSEENKNFSIGGACILIYGLFSSFTSIDMISISGIILVSMFFSLKNLEA